MTLEAWETHLQVSKKKPEHSSGAKSTAAATMPSDIDKELSMDIEDVAACLQYLATVEVELEDYARALTLFEREVEIFTQCFERKGKFTLARNAGIDITEKIGLHGEALTGVALCLFDNAAGSCEVQIGTEGASLEFRDEQLDAAKTSSFESDRKTVCNANSFQSEEGSAEIEESWERDLYLKGDSESTRAQ